MIRILCRAWEQTGGDAERWDAWVELGAKDIRELLSHRELFQMVRSREKSLVNMNFWSCCCRFYETDSFDTVLSARELATFDGNNLIVVPNEREVEAVLDSSSEAVTDNDQAIVEKNGVRFFCYLKAARLGVEAITELISYEMLLKALPIA